MTVDLADIPDLSFSLDQVPLGVQVVDWPGLAATTIPQVSPAYPNDIYAVLAGLQAWNRDDPVKPQVLQSDGQHALRVRIVNPGGAGIAAMTQLVGNGSQPVDDVTPITWNDPPVDTFGASMWDSANPTRLTAPADGHYIIATAYEQNFVYGGALPNYGLWGARATLYVNGVFVYPELSPQDLRSIALVTGFPLPVNETMPQSINQLISLHTGDYVEVVATHYSSTTHDPDGIEVDIPVFSMAQVA